MKAPILHLLLLFPFVFSNVGPLGNKETLRMVREASGKKGMLGRKNFLRMKSRRAGGKVGGRRGVLIVTGKISQPVHLGQPMTLSCNSNQALGFCAFKPPGNQKAQIFNSYTQLDGGRIKLSERSVRDPRVCEILVDKVEKKDLGKWGCVVGCNRDREYKGNWLAVSETSAKSVPTTTTTTTAHEQVILITGGRAGIIERLASTEVYPDIKTCSTPSLPKKTSDHALFMTAGTTPRVAYCGGYDNSKSCVVWDSNNQRWDESMMGPLPQRRRYHSAVTFENVGVYVIGVRNSNSKFTFFLPANSFQWKRGPGLPSGLEYQGFEGCAVPVSKNSFIYINNGVIREYKIDIANPASNLGWMPANRWPAISRRTGHGCARIGSYVLIAGGHGNSGILSSTKIIDIATREVRLGGNLVKPRYHHRLASVTTGGLTKTFALGGYGPGGAKYLSSVEEWDEDNLKWKPAGNLKKAKGRFAAITVPLSVVCPGSG